MLPNMNSLFPRIVRHLALSISAEETRFVKRGFRVTEPEIVNRLEKIGASFLDGYHSALFAKDLLDLENKLENTETPYRGFAFEGAAMSLTLLDQLSVLKKNRVTDFLQGEAGRHIYMVYVGIGWALARLWWARRRILRSISNLDSLLKWLAIDGFGFHEGYFNPRRYFNSKISLNWLPGYGQHAFAQGLGRSLWFVEGASINHISNTISRMPEQIRADLWSGIGLACAYAGGARSDVVKELKILSRPYFPSVAQGVAFAAKTRLRAGNPAAHTELACRLICGLSIDEAASLTDAMLKDLPETGDLKLPKYEIWRQRIQHEFSSLEVISA